MGYLEYLRKEESFDKYILFLLGLGFNRAEVIKLTGVSKQTVYSALKRNADIAKKFDL